MRGIWADVLTEHRGGEGRLVEARVSPQLSGRHPRVHTVHRHPSTYTHTYIQVLVKLLEYHEKVDFS